MSNSKFIIYGLCDPRTKDVRYVGKSCKGLSRPKEHFRSNSLLVKCPRSSWIISLKNIGLLPEIIIIDKCNKEELDYREIYWIKHLKNMGCKLTNLTDGGTGGNTGCAYKKYKPVISINIKTGNIKRYDYVWQTENDGFSPTKVVAVCKGKRATHRGFYFHYEESSFIFPVKRTMKKVLCRNKKTMEEVILNSLKDASTYTGLCAHTISTAFNGKTICREFDFIPVNASLMNEEYDFVNEPIRVEISPT